MEFWTAQYPVEGQRKFSQVIQHYEYEGRQVCFACIGQQDDWCEDLYHWFRQEALEQLLKASANAMEKMERGLRRLLRREERRQNPAEDISGRETALAGVLCVDEEFLAFQRGNMGIWCLNTAFGKAHAESLGAEGNSLEIYSGRLEEGVAILLATGDFTVQLRERWLLEGLFVSEMKQEWQMQKRLLELGKEASRNSTGEVGGILVRSCGAEELFTEHMDFKPGDSVSQKRIDEIIGTGGMWNEGKGTWPDEFRENASVNAEERHIHLIWGVQLGQGAFARVYQVRDSKTGQVYACKKSPNISMLWREYCIGRELEHPLFPKVYKFWQEGPNGFLLMEYVPGTNMKELLNRRAGFSVNQTIRVGMELAEGLLYLHEWKYPCLFRDVKPENIVIRQDGRIKLLDMGCVCVKGAQGISRAGSPGFAAPEQLEPGRMLDVTCDVYAVGKTLEAMLDDSKRKSGKRCLIKRKRFVRRRLERIVKQCTNGNPLQRIPDMRWLLLMLAQVQTKKRNKSACVGKRAVVNVRYWKKLRCLKNIWERSVETS